MEMLLILMQLKIIGKKDFIIEDLPKLMVVDNLGNNVGKYSDLACYSFYPGKILVATMVGWSQLIK